MSAPRRLPAELFDELRQSLPTLSSDRAVANGLNLLVDDVSGHLGRMQQARRVLVTEHILASVAAPSRPVMLMKGLEVAHLYPTTLQRPFRDIDILMFAGRELWDQLVSEGYRQHPSRRMDIDHHHLPPIADPSGTIGVEIHSRPNLPRWARIPVALLFETALPSRTGIPGVTRPRDDLHALLMALHCWKGGFTKQRDLLDALLLAAVSEVSVESTAAELGLARFWQWTKRLADAELFGRSSRSTQLVSLAIMPRQVGVIDRNRSRLVAPYLIANPWRVTSAHLADYRLGRAARQPSVSSSTE